MVSELLRMCYNKNNIIFFNEHRHRHRHRLIAIIFEQQTFRFASLAYLITFEQKKKEDGRFLKEIIILLLLLYSNLIAMMGYV